jgi:hypothetical protein
VTLPSPERIFERVRALCLALPETEELSAWGHPNFKAGKKTFVAFERYEGRPSVAFRVREADVLALLADRRFFAPRFRGWICLAADGRVDWKELERLVMGSYRLVAPARLAAEAPRAAPRRRRPSATPRRRAGPPRRKR